MIEEAENQLNALSDKIRQEVLDPFHRQFILSILISFYSILYNTFILT